jgi:DNA-directed RNA polymerase specialized sigma24 family protein
VEVTRAWELSPSSFDRLLRELSPDRESAAAEYEALRLRLTKFFEWRRCPDPEQLADRTLDRLAQRLEGGAEVGQIYSYCCGIARHLMLEAQRVREREAVVAQHLTLLQAPPRGRGEALVFEVLQGCLQRLPTRSRQLVLGYYEKDKQAKIEHRRGLADHLGIPLNALRSRAFRVRTWLEGCVEESLRSRNVPAESVTQK